MESDEEGFLYPHIETDSCIDCHACIDHCPIYKDEAALYDLKPPLAVYAGWALDYENRMSGSSGGIFGELAKAVLQRDGYVAGAAFTSEHQVRHQLIHSLEDLPRLKKSKYVQSDMGTVFPDIQRLVERGEQVLFAGTPCQCAGLRAFLDGQPENLILCDFICHGVNSPLVHQRYICEVEQKLGKKVTGIDHRDKSGGWKDFNFKVSCGQHGFLLGNQRKNPFLRGFLTNLYLRMSCYNCSFKGISRPTDLTLADCWGYSGNELMGVSLIFVQSPKGKNLLEEIRSDVWLEDYLLEDALNANPSIRSSAIDRFQKREAFWTILNENGNLDDTIIKLLGYLK